MSCLICGDVCRCSSGADSAASPRWLADGEALLSSYGTEGEGPETESGKNVDRTSSDLHNILGDRTEPATQDSSSWRQEVASRLNRYQARHKPRPPRYPSLRLRFDVPQAAGSGESLAGTSAFTGGMKTASNSALALDTFVPSDACTDEHSVNGSVSFSRIQAREGRLSPSPAGADVVPTTPTAKIIEFPRSWTPPQAPLDQLAEPVTDRPRILEVPEVVPPAPALGGITIEPVQQPEVEKRPGIDVPLQSAPLARRIFSAAIDGFIIAAACALFGFIFGQITPLRPPPLEMAALGTGFFGLFWAVYQYLLLVYSGSTPGLRLVRLELALFDGRPPGRNLRRWRVLASFLSAISLGMGYAWVFLDEDALCWHDRITHTYLAPKKLTETTTAPAFHS